MAALDLSLDEFFEDVSEEQRNAQLTQEGYSDSKALRILDTFLQPDSTMTLETVQNLILDLLPPWENRSGTQPAISFAYVCYEVALHIPWKHPSQLKLAWLIERLGWSDRFSDLANIKTPGDRWRRQRPLTKISRECWDDAQIVDRSDPKELQAWVSCCAFEAKLDALNVYGHEPPYIRMTMETTFDKPEDEADCRWHANAPGVERAYRDAFIMGAAQWIIWDGQTLYRRALYKGFVSGPITTSSGVENAYIGMTLVTLEKLKLWKQGFGDAAEEEGISEEAKEVALRAFRIMDVLETAMGSS